MLQGGATLKDMVEEEEEHVAKLSPQPIMLERGWTPQGGSKRTALNQSQQGWLGKQVQTAEAGWFGEERVQSAGWFGSKQVPQLYQL